MNKWASHIFWVSDAAKEILNTVICTPGKRVTLIIGEGFDPRMTDCIKLLVSHANVQIQIFLLKIGRAGIISQPELSEYAKNNLEEVKSLLAGKCEMNFIDTEFEEEDRDSTAPSASDKAADFAREIDMSEIDSLIVDISALPQGLYFPLLEVLVGQRCNDFQDSHTSLYVFVSENVELDRHIAALELQEDAYLVPPFRSALTGTEDSRPIIWFPVLGEDEAEQISRVEKLLPPRVEREVCPVLPMPSSNPRRADMLIREYETFLQDSWLIDSRSFIYSDEQNPFHLYEQLSKAALRYREALSDLGGCRAVISCHSSKLLSLGALLAASELNMIDSEDFAIGLANVDATSYRFDDQKCISMKNSIYLIPLLGEVYDA